MSDHELHPGPGDPGDPGRPGEPGEPAKGRQRVRRHWKPTLGRFIDVYIRKGEHAAPKLPGEAGPDELDPGAVPPRRRRIVAAAGALAAVAAAIVAWRLVAPDAHAVAFEILAAREPFVVRIDCGPATGVVLGDDAAQERCVSEAATSVLAADRAHPDRLVVIELVSPPISFTSLRLADQKEMRRALGASAGLRYEETVAGLLERMMESAGRGRVSVLGLPVERREVGIDASGRTNGSYGAVIDRLDCLVSGHVFYRGDSTISAEQLVEQTLIEALRHRGGRPVVFRQGATWRVLVGRDAPGPQQQAARRLVIADAGG
jgi:hypothetical protein